MTSRFRFRIYEGIVVALGIILGAPLALGQACYTWRPLTGTALYGDFYYDTARRAISVLSLTDAGPCEYTWTGGEWLARSLAPGPSARSEFSAGYDAARHRLVIFGGRLWPSGMLTRETWEWDRASWSLRSNTGPLPGKQVPMTFDPDRQRMVLFGDGVGAGLPSFTWEWDGNSWTRRATGGPARRTSATLRYDSGRRRVVLYSGYDINSVELRDTWEWDGQSWALAATGGPTFAQTSARMHWEAGTGRLAIWESESGTARVGHRFEWLGDRWERVAFEGPRAGVFSVAYDPLMDLNIAFAWSEPSYATWEAPCLAWVQRTAGNSVAQLPVVYDGAMDRHIFIQRSYPYYTGETGIFDGLTWSFRPGAPGGQLAYTGMAYDAANGNIVAFGGGDWDIFHGDFTVLGTTFIWDGQAWTSKNAGGSARYRHAMTYDSARGRVVLFGGQHRDTYYSWYFNDTWEWDGSAWSLAVSSGPSLRAEPGLAFDPRRSRCVLFGGQTETGTYLGDTWEYDGQAWSRSAETGPSPREATAMCFHPGLGRVVLFGGTDGAPASPHYLSDTWAWDGTAWEAVPVTRAPPVALPAQFSVDKARGRALLFQYEAGTFELLSADAVVTQPDDRTSPRGGRAVFRVAVAEPDGVSYRWRHDSVPLVDGARISGSATGLLVIDAVERADAGGYEAVVTSPCASQGTRRAVLTVLCPSDLNRDGKVDQQDLELFIAAFESGDAFADYNGDGFVDGIDYDQFYNDFEAGC